MTNNVRLQNLRDFTVQIRRADNDTIVGTGFVVSLDGKVVTCAHVVKAAGVDPHVANQRKVGVYFPQARSAKEKIHYAVVEKFFSTADDDVILLKIIGRVSQLVSEQLPKIGTAELSQGDMFRSYGYRPLPPYVAGWADGTIMGPIDSPNELNLQVEPIQLSSEQISPGMSGSAVLDIRRNLIVGIISETYYPKYNDPKDAKTAWAINTRVLSLEPISLYLQSEFETVKALVTPRLEFRKAKISRREKASWNNAPAVLLEWIGRKDLLNQLTEDWLDENKHITGLIGFGGEGKSSLARKWVDQILTSPNTAPESFFWWGFYENSNVDEFLEAALKFMSGGAVDIRKVRSSSVRAQMIGTMIGTTRCLFILDGLEVLQHQDGDQYGLLQSTDLRDLLTFFAHPDSQSFCLITSRVPLFDLIDYSSYTHRDVERLSNEDARTMLKNLGVQGSEKELDKLITEWDGHALTLSLLAALLVEHYNGNIDQLDGFSPYSSASKLRGSHVQNILRKYDQHISNDEKKFLEYFSAFRLPVPKSAITEVLYPLVDSSQVFISKLLNYRILRISGENYTVHPLIREHYFDLFKADSMMQDVHGRIAHYYLKIAGNKTPKHPTLEDLAPVFEAIHHSCSAGDYDTAYMIDKERIDQGERWVITYELGAHEASYRNQLEYFPNLNLQKEPLLDLPERRGAILNGIAVDLMDLGRLSEIPNLIKRAIKNFIKAHDYTWASMAYQNLAEFYSLRGQFDKMFDAATEANKVAKKITNQEKRHENTRDSYACQGWAKYQLGDLQAAQKYFEKADILQGKLNSEFPHIVDVWGIWYSKLLIRIKNYSLAKETIENNLKFCLKNDLIGALAVCYQTLSYLNAILDEKKSAIKYKNLALETIRKTTELTSLIYVLTSIGYSEVIFTKNSTNALSYLNEALSYALTGGYNAFEVDIRIAMAWTQLAKFDALPDFVMKNKCLVDAKSECDRALNMSRDMNYFWGKFDAMEVLKLIEQRRDVEGKEQKKT